MLRAAQIVALSTTMFLVALGHPSPAWAGDLVTYEVVSDRVGVVDIEWQDAAGRMWAQHVALPWRAEVHVREPLGPPPDGSQVRAHWQPSAAPTKWVAVRIFYRGKLICQNTLDVGHAACYGSTARIT